MGYASCLESNSEHYHANLGDLGPANAMGLPIGNTFSTDREKALGQARGILNRLNSGAFQELLKFITDFVEPAIPAQMSQPEEVFTAERELLRIGLYHGARLDPNVLRAFRTTLHLCTILRPESAGPEDQKALEMVDRWRAIEDRWQAFESERVRCLMAYRPRLGEVGPLELSVEQRELVLLNRRGHHRINAAAGTGKTVVLAHRAIRLFTALPHKRVLVVTPSDSLALELKNAVSTLSGIDNDDRLRIRSLPQIVDTWYADCGRKMRVPTTDQCEGEWKAFVDAADAAGAHVLKYVRTTMLLDELKRGLEKLAPRASVGIERPVSLRSRTWIERWRQMHYVRDEIAYVASGFYPKSLAAYTGGAGTAPAVRTGREIRVAHDDRLIILELLESWKTWLAAKGLVDSTVAAADIGEELHASSDLARAFQDSCGADHVLVDEAQEFGNCEWSFVLRLVRDLGIENALLAAGDLAQVGRIRRVLASEIRKPDGETPFSFKGRASNLSKQFRITKHIGAAAERLVSAYPKPTGKAMHGADMTEGNNGPASVEDSDVAQPGVDAVEDGTRPLMLVTDNQERDIAPFLRLIKPPRTLALLTARNDDADVALCERIAHRAGCDDATRFKRVGQRCRSRVAYGTIESVGGCEFDVVFILNFSALPASHLPEKEWWREAATAYQAITRARELVILSCPSRSPFVDTLRNDALVQVIDGERSLNEYLSRSGSS